MPSIAKEQKEFYKSKIRSLMATDHGVSRRELQERLDKNGLHLDRDYIGKLYDEILVERTKRMDRPAVECRALIVRRYHDRSRQAGMADRKQRIYRPARPSDGAQENPRSS